MTRKVVNEEERPIDFAWLTYIGMNKLGFTYRQAGQMYFGFWLDLYESYKKQYNFEIKRSSYLLQEAETVSSLDEL